MAINRKRDGLPTTWSIWENPRNNGSYVKDKFEFKYIGGINNLSSSLTKIQTRCALRIYSHLSSILLAAGSETLLAGEDERLYSQANKEAHVYYSGKKF